MDIVCRSLSKQDWGRKSSLCCNINNLILHKRGERASSTGYVHSNDSNSMVICMYCRCHCRPYLSKQSLAYQLTGLLNNNAANPSSQLLVYTTESILVKTYFTVMMLMIGVETVEAKWCFKKSMSNGNLLLFFQLKPGLPFHFGVLLITKCLLSV